MKKVNTNKVQAVAEQQTNKKVTKSFKTETKTVQVEVTNIQLYDDVAVSLESDVLHKMENWAYKVQEELAFDTPYTEDELNEMIVDAGLILNLFEDKANEYGDNTYQLCKSIIRMCIHRLDEIEDSKSKETKANNDAKQFTVKPKYDLSTLPIDIECVYRRLYADFVNVRDNDMFGISYTRDELYSISGKAARTLNELDNYDCSDICNVEVTKYLCNEVINMVNNLLDVILADSISGKDNKTQKAIGYEEYTDF